MDEMQNQVQNLTNSVNQLLKNISKLQENLLKTSNSGRSFIKKKHDREKEEEDKESEAGEEDEKEEDIGKSSKPNNNLKVDFKIDIPVYEGVVDADKLDGWLDRLETYLSGAPRPRRSYLLTLNFRGILSMVEIIQKNIIR